jgi:hypothetical protein
MPAGAIAESYAEKKDNDALESIERILKKASDNVNKDLFDGKAVVSGANPADIRLYNDTMQGYFNNAANVWNGISKAGMASPRAQKLLPHLQNFEKYTQSLKLAITEFSKQQQSVQKQGNANKLEQQKTCINFRNQISPQDRQELQSLVSLQRGSTLIFYQDVNEIEQSRQTIKRLKDICSKPELSDIEHACLSLDPVNRPIEADYCKVPNHEVEILQQGAKNYAVKLMGMTGASKPFDSADFKKKEGWVSLEGAVTWDSLSKSEKTSELLLKRVKPVFEAVGLNGADDIDALQKQNTKNAQMEDAIRQSAADWKTPGESCNGEPCKLAKRTIQKYYPNGDVVEVRQKQENWVIVEKEIQKIPDYRYRSGWVLVRVPGDPFCQLRSWTVEEKYSGGGSYQAQDDARIGYVRWQNCS